MFYQNYLKSIVIELKREEKVQMPIFLRTLPPTHAIQLPVIELSLQM
jgi:hypothetical protein